MWVLVFALSIFFQNLSSDIRRGLDDAVLQTSLERTPDVVSHRVCDQFCIEVLELKTSTLPAPSPQPPLHRGVVLLIPGFFHNYRIFDLSPETDESYARLLRDRLGLKVYFFHPRGIGASDRPLQLTMDDIASRDLPLALEFVARREKERVLLIGHSQGSIVAQASLGGLSPARDNSPGGRFDPALARARQSHVRGLVLLAGNVAMRGFMSDIAQYDSAVGPWLERLGWFPARLLTARLSPVRADASLRHWGPLAWVIGNPLSGPHSIAYWAPGWAFLYRRENISPELWLKNYDRSLQSTSAGIIRQFARAVSGDGLHTLSDVSYREALPQIDVPTIQLTFGSDPMANAESTRVDDYDHIGRDASVRRGFHTFANQGHEDFFMNRSLAEEHLPWIERLLKSSPAR